MLSGLYSIFYMNWLWVGVRAIPWTTCWFLNDYRTKPKECYLFAEFWYYEEPAPSTPIDQNSPYYDPNTGYNYYDDYQDPN
jgi:hypothetical protein